VLSEELLFFINIAGEYGTGVKRAECRSHRLWDVGNLEMLEKNSSDGIFEVLASVTLKFRVTEVVALRYC
jgi:hypothetical protein